MGERPKLSRDVVLAAVAAGTHRYFADRRARVGPFVDQHFTLRGTLALHRAAFGWDIVKAPVNLFLAPPLIAARLAAWLAAKMGARSLARTLRRPALLPTAVARRIEWLIYAELLELPFRQGTCSTSRDALAEAILAVPAVAQAIELAHRGEDPALRERLRDALREYTSSRTAAAEITTGLLSLSVGALAFNKLTPGAATLGPTLAGIVAQQAAVASFPLGGWLGAAWYALFPVLPSAGLLWTTTGALVMAATSFAAFAGVIADPVQRALGLHRARLLRMIAALERQFADPAAPGFAVHDHYVARLLDLMDLVSLAVRVTRP